jgi:hypothetical protein
VHARAHVNSVVVRAAAWAAVLLGGVRVLWFCSLVALNAVYPYGWDWLLGPGGYDLSGVSRVVFYASVGSAALLLVGGLSCLRAPSRPGGRRILGWAAVAELLVVVTSAALDLSRTFRYPNTLVAGVSLATRWTGVLGEHSARLILPALVLYLLTRRTLVTSPESA